ncbi:MAG: hypothetical protein GYA57_06245 [Myxococcales bacterium]|nr:hypothetical protein [Myxococcales bacterium]
MNERDFERKIEEFEAAYAASQAAAEDLAARAGVSGRSEDWLRGLPAPVADAVRRAAGDWARRFEASLDERPAARVVAVATAGGRISPADFVYRTMGR